MWIRLAGFIYRTSEIGPNGPVGPIRPIGPIVSIGPIKSIGLIVPRVPRPSFSVLAGRLCTASGR